MRMVISILLWAVGFLYFGICCTIVIVLTFFLSSQTIDPLIKKMLRILLIIMFIHVESEGEEKIDRDSTCLFMSNHVNLFDIPLLQGYIPNFVRGIEANLQFKWPFYGWAIRRLGNIPIDRENIHASIRSIAPRAPTWGMVIWRRSRFRGPVSTIASPIMEARIR